MTVAEHRRRAIEQRRLRKRTGRHHAALDVDMRIDQAGCQDPAAGFVALRTREPRFRVGPRCLHRRDAAALDPHLAIRVDTLSVSRKYPCTGDHEVGCGPPHRDAGERAGHGVQRGDREAGKHDRTETIRAPLRHVNFPDGRSRSFVDRRQRQQQLLQLREILSFCHLRLSFAQLGDLQLQRIASRPRFARQLLLGGAAHKV